jgi:hypothetical protein
MKRFLIALFMAATAFSANAKTISTQGLTAEQVAQLQKQAAEMSQNPANTAVLVREEAEAWADLGGKIGQAMVGAAKEVGMAANEFAQTGLGRVVVAIVVYKVIGQEVLGLFFGSLILLVGIPVFLRILFDKTFFADHVEYEAHPRLWGLWISRRVKVVRSGESDVGRVLVAAIGLIVTMFAGLAIAL